MNRLPVFQCSHVRDLAWLCFSPTIFDSLLQPKNIQHCYPPMPQREQLIEWLTTVDSQPSLLQQHLSSLKSPRLGIYYEALCAFYWQHFPGQQLLYQNLQVRHNNTTLGEFDFIVQSASERYHLEVAVKFYLGVPSSDYSNDKPSQWLQWIGPNCNDSLEKKLLRLRDHQLLLKDSAAGRLALQEKGITTDNLHVSLQLQGYLFYPAHANLSAPEGCNPRHSRGLWYYLQDFSSQLSPQGESLWLILDKPDWLAPAAVNDSEELLNNAALNHQLLNYFAANTTTSQTVKPAKNRPLLLAKMGKRGQFWYETKRCFIVPNNWPW